VAGLSRSSRDGVSERPAREAGFASRLADRLGRDVRYDLHALLELTDRGCPAALAARILAPLESESAPSR